MPAGGRLVGLVVLAPQGRVNPDIEPVRVALFVAEQLVVVLVGLALNVLAWP